MSLCAQCVAAKDLISFTPQEDVVAKIPVPEVNVDYELCPHCEGTGLRPVVELPPTRKRGESGPRGSGQHGTNSMYSYGCRCELCRAGHRAYAAACNAARATA